MQTGYRVLPAVRGFKVYCDREQRTLSIHERLEEAIRTAGTLAVAEHVRFEVLDHEGEVVQVGEEQ